mmetsp:Transcript_48665/g.113086  ORF Transcript_48665/g.113086 Transcript_48665/m.113086 type:complete len:217 (-) Transcript_48665:673-1323(-)
MYTVLVLSRLSYNQSSALVNSLAKASRSAAEMNSPYSSPSLIFALMFKMYASRSFLFSSVSIISRISACIALSASMSCCNLSSLRPGVPVAETLRSVFFVRRFVFFTSTHSNRGSFFLGLSAGFSSTFSSPSALSPSGLLSSSSPGFFASESAGFSAAPSLAAASASPPPSCGCPPSAVPFAGSSGASSSFSGGNSRFSLTTSSYSSSSTSWAPSI